MSYSSTMSCLGPTTRVLSGIIPWRRGGSVGRIVATERTTKILVTPAVSTSEGCGRPLDDIMGFAPLRDAFGEFCRKALCSEVIQTSRYLVGSPPEKMTVYTLDECIPLDEFYLRTRTGKNG